MKRVTNAQSTRSSRSVGPLQILVSIAIILLLLLGSLTSAEAQSGGIISLSQALEQAGSRNAQIQLGTIGVAQQQALRRTAYDAGRLSGTVLFGQYNSRRFDHNLTVSQTIPNPTLMRRLADLNDRAVANRQAAVAVTQNDVRYQVKAAYYDLGYLHQRRQLYRQQDTVLAEFVQAANLRFKTGETGSLEKATAESQRADQQVRLAQLEAELTAARTRLKTLLYSPNTVDAGAEPLPKLHLPYNPDSLLLTQPGQNPQVRLLQSQIRVAEQSRLVEQTRSRPDFLVGLTSQTLIGNQLIDGQEIYFGPGYRFTAGQLGVTFPLFGKAQKARVEAARVGEQLAQTELQAGQFGLNQQLQQAVGQYVQYRNALTYYEQNGLAQAQLIQTNARRAFRGGDIGYVEFSLAIQQALTIRSSYLDLLNQYNQSVLYITYLLGNP